MNPEFDQYSIEELLELLTRKLTAADAPSGPPPACDTIATSLPEYRPEPCPPSRGRSAGLDTEKRSYTLQELLRPDDEEFVRTAYRCILKREPDLGGFTHYITQLRACRLNKINIISRLRYSGEGKKQHVGIPGLLCIAPFAMVLDLPLLGAILSYPFALLGSPWRLRRVSKQIYATNEKMESMRCSLNESIEHLNEAAAQLRHLGDLFIASRKLCENTAARQNFFAEKVQQAESSMQTITVHIADTLAQMQSLQRTHAAQFSEMQSARAADLANGAEQTALIQKKLAALHAGRIEDNDNNALLLKSLDTRIGELRKARIEDNDNIGMMLKSLENKANELRRGRIEDNNNIGMMIESLEDRLKKLKQARAEDNKDIGSIISDIQEKLNEVQTTHSTVNGSVDRLLSIFRRKLAIQAHLEKMQAINDMNYVEFENIFRGLKSDIRSRLMVYLPYLQEYREAVAKHPVLDCGCGRGEMLEICQEHDIPAIGIDMNAMSIQNAKKAGLNTLQEDVFTYLEKCAPSSHSVITAIHIIEHFVHEEQLYFYDLALRALIPGGLLIVETPNGGNLLVGGSLFYGDPTHRTPLLPQATAKVIGGRGFATTVLPLQHYDKYFQQDSEPTELEKRYICTHMDFAVLARKK